MLGFIGDPDGGFALIHITAKLNGRFDINLIKNTVAANSTVLSDVRVIKQFDEQPHGKAWHGVETRSRERKFAVKRCAAETRGERTEKRGHFHGGELAN